ncbi:MAG TPA: thiamine phosphate synthase [Gallionellaceae bacterium]
MNRRRAIKGLYAITPDLPDTAELVRRARLALQGGAQVLQYRSKLAEAALRLSQAEALRPLTREYGATYIVNDDARLAAAVDADGVHLGADDGEIGAARALLGADKLIGASCYNRLALARTAVAAGADYVAFGAFHTSSTKPGAVIATTDLLHEARTLGVPVVAIGGITAANGAALIAAGADALAVITALFEADDIKAAAQDLAKLFSQAHVT